MYRDTEQSYRGYTIDAYEADGGWRADFWCQSPTKQGSGGSFLSRRRRYAIQAAKNQIDQELDQ